MAVSGSSQTKATQVVQNPCSATQNQLWGVSPASIPSNWTNVISLAVNPIAVANLPNGKLLTWSAFDLYNYEADIGQTNGSFVLMRLSSVTHTVNNDQRRIPLQIQSTSGSSSYVLSIPSDPGTVLRGYYMLFALDARGVPSVAATILIS